MWGPVLNRRQLMQWGAAASLIGNAWGIPTQKVDEARIEAQSGLATDPFLQLALACGFADHDLQVWPLSMRMLLRLQAMDRTGLAQVLGSDVSVQSTVSDELGTWATVSLSRSALLRWHEQGLSTMFCDHAWGAPWAHGSGVVADASPAQPRLSAEQTTPNPDRRETRWGRACAGAPHRVLVIDHGFPLRHLQACGVPFHHLGSHAGNRPEHLLPAASHGAQVLGLLLEQALYGKSQGDVPLMLYELPDALLGAMPMGALWPDVFDAVCWGLRHAQAGQTLWVLLSVVSTDGDRGSVSIISQSAQALARHAQRRGVELKWIMAAGNSHADQQNLSFQLAPGETAIWQWQLPSQNLLASTLECWHSGGDVPRISVQPPGQAWAEAHEAWTLAQRHDPRQGRTQTVMRLAPTMALDPSTTRARSGIWRVRWPASSKSTRLDLSLSMMASHDMGMYRQARLAVDPSTTARPLPPLTLSGLVPHMPGVWVAQTLNPAQDLSWVLTPHQNQLDVHSGRWPSEHDLHGVRHVGVRVDGSLSLPGVQVISRHGHRIQRASGTSMAVPLALGSLWRDQPG